MGTIWPGIPEDGVVVKVAPPIGDPGAPVGEKVAVTVKPWYQSSTILIGLLGLAGSITDAVVDVLIPVLQSNADLDIKKLWKPALIAAFSAYIAWRRKQDNTVVGGSAK